MFETTFDRMMYPIGFKTTIIHSVRKWKNRPALAVGQAVTIVRLDWQDLGGGNLIPRVEVEAEDGTRRWIDGSSVVSCTTGNEKAMERIGEIAEEFFARRD